MYSYDIKPYIVEPLSNPAASRKAPDAANAMRWFAPEWTMLPLSPRRCLIRNPLNGTSAELSSGEYAVLSACEGCATLEQHEERAARKLAAPQAHRAAFRGVLERCAEAGLLVSLPDLVARLGPARESELPPPEIVVRSAARPQLLRRLLVSAARLQERTGAAYHWHMIDDSRDADDRRGNREAMASAPQLNLTYHDLSREPLESQLVAAFPAMSNEVRALLQAGGPEEYTCARPLHYALLRFAGRRFLHLDDDVLVEPRRPPWASRGVETSVRAEAARWYESFDAAFSACPELALDPFAAHARWLGRPVSEAWSKSQSEPGGHRLEDLPSALGVSFTPQARIVFTGTHVLGDPGWGTFSGQQLAVSPDTLQWLAEHPESAPLALESQIQWRGWPALQLAPQLVLSMTTLSGIDDSVLIAPALRVGRATDIIVSEVTRAVHPAGWRAVLPFALPHLRPGRRRWLKPSDPYVLRPTRLLITYAHQRSASLRSEDPAQRLAGLGQMFVDLAGAGDATLAAILEEQAADYGSRVLFSIHEQLDDAAAPEAWKAVLRPWLESPALKLDAASLRNHVVSLESLRSLARDYGRTLLAWPQLWQHCRDRFQ